MMNIVENQSLKTFNTFGVDINSRYFFELREVSQLSDISQLPKPHLFLGVGVIFFLQKIILGQLF